MKIITDNCAYVQKNDIAYLNHTDLPILASIFMKVFGDEIVFIDDSNRYEFVKFDDPQEVEFFKNINWMIDYNDVKDLSEEEIISMGQNIAQEKNEIAKKFNAMSDENKRKNQDMIKQCELLDYKMYSLRDVLWYKQGHIKMTLPEGIEYPAGYQVPKNGIKKLIKSIIKNRK